MGVHEAMKRAETLLLEMEVLDDGAVRARRKDDRRLSKEDWKEVTKWVDSSPGITVDDVIRIFPGARVVSKT
jgi:hypothetical protein